jgi:hypothetical protein
MSFAVKKSDVAGLAKMGSVLGNQRSVAIAGFSARGLAEDVINGNVVTASPVMSHIEEAAKVQVGMTRKPSI